MTLCYIITEGLRKYILYYIADYGMLPESLSGFHYGHGTIDMIFVVENIDLCQVFIDLSLWYGKQNCIVGGFKELSCPEKFIAVLWSFHNIMKAWVNTGGKLSEPILVKNRIKKGDIPDSIL